MSDSKASLIAVAGVSAVLGGVIGSSFTAWFAGPRPPPRAHAEAPAPLAARDPSPALEGRVAALERSMRALGLERAGASRNPNGATASARPESPPAADVGPIVDNPVFDAAVRDVLERAEHERDLEREAERAEWRKRAAEQWAGDMTEKLRLTEMQKAKALAIATNFWEKMRDLRQGDAGTNLPRREWRARLDELRRAAEAELVSGLSSAQASTYRELDESSRLGSRRSLRAIERASRGAD